MGIRIGDGITLISKKEKPFGGVWIYQLRTFLHLCREGNESADYRVCITLNHDILLPLKKALKHFTELSKSLDPHSLALPLIMGNYDEFSVRHRVSLVDKTQIRLPDQIVE